MATNNPNLRRQFPDVFDLVAGGWATASPGAIANNASGSVAITVTGVDTSGAWCEVAVSTTATNLQVAGVSFQAQATAANTVTLTITNNSGGSITPTASSKYIVVMGKLNVRFTT